MNICLIGYGEVGKKFYRILKNYKNITIHIVEKKLIKFGKADYKFDKVELLPKFKEYFLVIICTPPFNRIGMFKSLNGYNIKNIICEKPLTFSLSEFQKINKIIIKNKFKVITNYTRNFLNEFKLIRNLIRKKKLGSPLVGHFYYSKGIYYNGTHFIDFALKIFGKPISINILNKKKSNLKNDFLIDFVFIYKNFRIYFMSFDTKKVSSTNFDLFFQKGKVEVSLSRKLKIYTIKKNFLFKNINQFSLQRTLNINYLSSYNNVVKYGLNLKRNKKKFGFVTNDKKIYSIIEKIKTGKTFEKIKKI
jgi:predicted dehydrogenase